ncbi:MAG: cbb3-type cytochrome oxidase assembly protein [Cyclobacteriaceae bacterium]
MYYITGEEAVSIIKPGQRVFVHGAAATPHFLLKKLAERAATLWNVEIVSISLQGDAVIADKKYKDNFRINSQYDDTYTPSVRILFENKLTNAKEQPRESAQTESLPEITTHDQPANEHVGKILTQRKIKSSNRRDRNTPAGRMIFDNKTTKVSYSPSMVPAIGSADLHLPV